MGSSPGALEADQGYGASPDRCLPPPHALRVHLQKFGWMAGCTRDLGFMRCVCNKLITAVMYAGRAVTLGMMGKGYPSLKKKTILKLSE